MKYKIEVRYLAAIEIIDAYNWYELQQEGLGLEFLDALEMFYDNLLNNPYTTRFMSKLCDMVNWINSHTV